MSTRQVSDRNDPVIESRDQLVAPMIKGEKPRERWRIGTEHEKLVFDRTDHHAPSYDEPGGIRDLLLALKDFGWSEVEEGGKVIAMAGSEPVSPDGNRVAKKSGVANAPITPDTSTVVFNTPILATHLRK